MSDPGDPDFAAGLDVEMAELQKSDLEGGGMGSGGDDEVGPVVVSSDELEVMNQSTGNLSEHPWYFQTPFATFNEIIIPSDWPRIMRMNSSVSNQFWGIIHQRLAEINDHPNDWTMG